MADEAVASLSTAGDVLWPLADYQGTIRDLATYDSALDQTSIANHLVYDSFGKLTSQTNSSVDHLFGFTGAQRDEESGLQYHRARYYDPDTGRWLSEDPSSFTAGDPNLARMVSNNPVSLSDPSGLQQQSGSGSGARFGLIPHTYGVGGTISGDAYVGGSFNYGFLFSFPDYSDPNGWQFGCTYGWTAGAGLPVDGPSGYVGITGTVSNADDANQLSGFSTTMSGSITPVAGPGGGISVGNLSNPTALGNINGSRPTAVTVSGGIGGGLPNGPAVTVSGGVQVGNTRVETVSVGEMKTIFIYIYERIRGRRLWND